MARWSEVNVDERKVLDYLLAADHPVGGDKATFFLTVGYTRAHWNQLRDDLEEIGLHGQIVDEHKTQFGYKYVIDGVIQTPNGRMIGLRTVWISDEADTPPRLVTAYPS
ncbi:DUF6883 domain-containing protein [Phytoactinopolyspora mesophila]|uniref:Adhesin n=1 Tax=Phytoactinopolyspora mesophila TaxID=2650750 RepID=A0A7K3M4T8_9ACTN|nr:DUF6883 domain-containing protein [Phytoactinopolyspora mesophila]NDL58331.1 adhesin [Phytoactinopolyspora mesophila]